MTEATFEGGLTVPAWLNSFASAATEHIHGVDILSPLGCHCYHNRARDEYELTLFASRTQVVGGGKDGREVDCNLEVEIDGLGCARCHCDCGCRSVERVQGSQGIVADAVRAIFMIDTDAERLAQCCLQGLQCE